jgi:multidrug resistance protein, MATE family
MGRIDRDGLAASSIVFRINGVAFFPVVGLATAVSMLVGQAQGAGRPDLSRRVTHRGLVLGELWMLAAAGLMVLAPQWLLDPFFSQASPAPAVRELCVKLLWFVAIYCVADGLNIVFMSMLQGVGDTRWLLVASGAAHMAFLATLLVLTWARVGVLGLWTAATAFICSIVLVWYARFRTHTWESRRVIDHGLPDIAEAPATAAPL